MSGFRIISNKFEKWWIKVTKLLSNMSKDHVSEFSAQCAYYVILSFIPFIILLFTLIQYTIIDSSQLFDVLSSLIPDSMNEMVLGIVREAYSKSFGTVSISIIFTLFSADRGLFALTKGLHLIYNFKDNKNRSWFYLKITSLFQTIMFIIFITISMVIMIFGKSIILTAKENFGLFENYTNLNAILTRMVILIISFVVFLCIYKFMSRRKLKLKSQIRGAVFSAIAINIVSYIFSRYLVIFKGFSITYGSLTTLMLIMMWTYTCFYIIFLGAEINKLYDKK